MILKRRLFLIAILALALCAPAGATEAARGDMVRLHVVAADDTSKAQALKLRVRDACLIQAQSLLADCESAEEAWDRVVAGLDALTRAAREEARANGYSGPVRAETGVYDFPDRIYGDTLVPAGRYRALRVVIGEGRGKNWWCVLYPSLCLPEEYRDGAPVRFHSALLDWLRNLFGGDQR